MLILDHTPCWRSQFKPHTIPMTQFEMHPMKGEDDKKTTKNINCRAKQGERENWK